MDREFWAGVADIVTALAFGVAAYVAWVASQQLKQSRSAHQDQTRPYVMLTVEPSPAHFGLLDIVIQNVGVGSAQEIKIKADPPFRRTRDVDDQQQLGKANIFAKPIAMLPPGFRLETFFDKVADRCEQKEPLPPSHKVEISYKDSSGRPYQETHIVDVEMYHDHNLLYTETYTVHDVAKSLREMEKLLKAQNQHLRGPIAVTTEPRGVYKARARAEHEEKLERMRVGRERYAKQGREQAETEGESLPDSVSDE